MAADYDAYATPYKKSKTLDFRVHGETPAHMAVLGDLRGRSAIDLACGDGFYTRLIRRAGASPVVGVDMSGEMIALANAEEAREPLGITYVQGRAEEAGSLGPFDVASAGFLLNNAPDLEILDAMCRACASCLVPGGRLVATNSQFGEHPNVDYSAYHLTTDVVRPMRDGESYRIFYCSDSDPFTLVNYHYDRSTYERLLRAAGFGAIHWHEATITPGGIERFGRAFWETYLEHPPLVVIEAMKR